MSTPSLEQMMHDPVQAIVSAIELRDPATAEHSLRVGNMIEAPSTRLAASQCRLELSHERGRTFDPAIVDVIPENWVGIVDPVKFPPYCLPVRPPGVQNTQEQALVFRVPFFAMDTPSYTVVPDS